jgi:dienelactone hydrolase
MEWKADLNPVVWREKALDAFRRALLEDSNPPDPEPQVLATEQRSGYAVNLISLALGRHRRSAAYLAIPDGIGPFPAALLLHDHGSFFAIGKEKLIRPMADSDRLDASRDWMDHHYGGHSLADDLAANGWIVFVTDALGWGDRTCGAYENQQAVACNLFNLGSSWAGLIACEDIAGAAYVASLPHVDPARVAAIGHSMGGFRSWQVSSLSDHIRASVSVCCFATLSSLMQPGGNRTRGQSAFTTTHPGIFRLMDIPDLAAIAAPKPMLMIHGTDDHLFPNEGVIATCKKTAGVYRAYDKEDRFCSIMRPGGHVFTAEDQKTTMDWLDRIGW